MLANGALFPAAALGIVLPLFLPVAVAVIAGDSIAGEAPAGTLRYLLVRPVGRTRLLVAKLVAVLVFLLLAVLVVAATAYVLGTRLFGSNRSPTSLLGHRRSPAAAGRPDRCSWCSTSAGRCSGSPRSRCSCRRSRLLARRGAGRARGPGAQPGAGHPRRGRLVRPYLPTRYWLSWVDLFRDPILWHDVQRGVLVQGVYVVVLLAVAWASFMTKDITS